MLVVEFSWTSFEVKMGFVCRILKHGRWAIMREKMGTNDWVLGLLDHSNWRKWCTRRCHVLSPEKRLLTNQITWKMSGILVWSTRWEQLNDWTFPQIIMWKSASHNGLVTLHFYMNIKKKLICTKINIFDVHEKFALKWQLLFGINFVALIPRLDSLSMWTWQFFLPTPLSKIFNPKLDTVSFIILKRKVSQSRSKR